jgi:mono/diheme cytochrome c family protein
MLYPIVLFSHSWLRWVVLGAALLVVVRFARARSQRRPWSEQDQKLFNGFVGLVDLQFSLGFLLYVWLSPIVHGAFANMGVAMKSAPLRFFAIEHITAMFLAVAFVHIAQVRSKRASDEAHRHRLAFRGGLAFLLTALIGIPWPGLKQARPLARTQVFEALSDDAQGQGPEVYAKRCASCHGAGGHGDGLAATAMQPRPRNFADSTWQAGIADAEIEQAIRAGGLSRQLSASMPSHPDLTDQQVSELVRFVRSVR